MQFSITVVAEPCRSLDASTSVNSGGHVGEVISLAIFDFRRLCSIARSGRCAPAQLSNHASAACGLLSSLLSLVCFTFAVLAACIAVKTVGQSALSACVGVDGNVEHTPDGN